MVVAFCLRHNRALSRWQGGWRSALFYFTLCVVQENDAVPTTASAFAKRGTGQINAATEIAAGGARVTGPEDRRVEQGEHDTWPTGASCARFGARPYHAAYPGWRCAYPGLLSPASPRPTAGHVADSQRFSATVSCGSRWCLRLTQLVLGDTNH